MPKNSNATIGRFLNTVIHGIQLIFHKSSKFSLLICRWLHPLTIDCWFWFCSRLSADDLKIGLDKVEALKVKTSVDEFGVGPPPTKVEQGLKVPWEAELGIWLWWWWCSMWYRSEISQLGIKTVHTVQNSTFLAKNSVFRILDVNRCLFMISAVCLYW